MRIRELADASGVSIATLKYYLRENLLHSGTLTAVNQADYDASHVKRVRLLRALMHLGRLSAADAQRVLAAVDDETIPIHDAFAIAQDAMVPARDRPPAAYRQALADVDSFVKRNGMRVRPNAAVREMLADAVVTLTEMGFAQQLGSPALSNLDGLVPATLALSASEVGTTPIEKSRSEQMEHTVIGTVAFEVVYDALRRMALEHASAERFGKQL